MCFRDTTFCASPTHHPDCDRRWTPELAGMARVWWGGDGAPVAFADFCGGQEEQAQEAEFGCEYCRNDGRLIDAGGTPRCPKCDAEYPDEEQARG